MRASHHPERLTILGLIATCQRVDEWLECRKNTGVSLAKSLTAFFDRWCRMTTPMNPILVPESLADDAIARLNRAGNVVHAAPGDAEFSSAAPHATAMVIRTKTVVRAELLDQLPKLKVIGRAGVGVDHIELGACAARGITVVNTPDANTLAVVEYVTALVLDHIRPRPNVTGAMDDASWNAMRREATSPREIAEMTVGVIGVGRIGRRVARVFAALGAKVLVHDLDRTAMNAVSSFDGRGPGIEPTDAHTLIRDSDVITIHVDGRAANRDLVGRDFFVRSRPDLLLVNVSRGLVVDHAALADFLSAHPAAAAILDVYEPEPIPADSPLLGHPQARLLAHLGSRTDAAQRRMADVVDDVIRCLAGETPLHPVKLPPLSG